MIVRIQASGASFRGAGQYYLHDKAADASMARELKPRTDERVWFTDTRNLMSTDPERAFDEMWRTADDQAYLKVAAGVRTSGRRCEEPVKTLSLSWHKDDAPTPEHMVAAADKLLAHMGWQGHQAVYVGHNDTEHRHIHVVLNRVHPESGRTLDDFRERKRAQEWALAYEKEQQNIRCEQRENNAAHCFSRKGTRDSRAPDLDGVATDPSRSAERKSTPERAPANDHLPHNVVMLARPHEQDFTAQEHAREEQDRSQRAELKAEQRTEREAYFKDGAKLFKATRHAVYDEVRKGYAPEWRQYYKEREAAEREADAASASGVTRALYFAGRGEWEQARDAFDNRDSVRHAVAKEFDDRKADLRQRQNDDLRERQRDACDALREIRDVHYQDLLQRQRDERAAVRAGRTIDDIRLAPEARTVGHGDGVDMPPPANANLASEQRSLVPEAPSPGIAAPSREGDHQSAAQLQIEAPAAASAPTIDPSERTAKKFAAELPVGVTPEAPEAVHQGADLAAGAIGSLANVIADIIGDIISPTPPELRKALVEAEQQRDAERPPVDDKAAAYKRIVDKAVTAIEQERADEAAWWKERDRGKGWERDR